MDRPWFVPPAATLRQAANENRESRQTTKNDGLPHGNSSWTAIQEQADLPSVLAVPGGRSPHRVAAPHCIAAPDRVRAPHGIAAPHGVAAPHRIGPTEQHRTAPDRIAPPYRVRSPNR